MAGIRLILLVVVLGGLILLLVQNFSPALPLVFLGMRTQPLPLSLWILFSIAAGGLTSFVIASLFKFTNYFTQQASSSKSTTTAPRVKTNPKKETIPPPSNPRRPVADTDYTTSNEFDDWETDANQGDDWDVEEPQQTPSPKTYPNQQAPKNVSQSDSVYSYSSQEPKNTGVGKTESIYDADYRVIIPPYQPPTTNPTTTQSDDDWDFFEDEDFADDNERPRR
ncbi:LapA family protein [Anabaena sphaerica FACHB-251]|uniref:LapA family protein n=1 Tax=Anabaena sphaerica FACHB-251 TaxID=2692883 RepID=A0A926WJ67_9NOST|nr:LapA family protein [Anabaena sphaerica]MBD2295584.1 LapA family protein [Anabaena sphaerica FACHB-251]